MQKASVDFLLRSVTTAFLSIVLVGAVVFEQLVQHRTDSVLVGWAGLVVGSYFTGHFSQNGRMIGKMEAQEEAKIPVVVKLPPSESRE